MKTTVPIIQVIFFKIVSLQRVHVFFVEIYFNPDSNTSINCTR